MRGLLTAVGGVLCVWALACGTPSVNSDGGSGGGAGGGLASGGGAGGGGGGGTGGGAGGGAGGGGGANLDGGCASACDCDPGLACFNRQCVAGFAPVYCCTSNTCPSGSSCQFPTRNFSRCGQGDAGFALPDGGFTPRDGGFDWCPFVLCASDQRCLNAGCTTCAAGGACTK